MSDAYFLKCRAKAEKIIREHGLDAAYAAESKIRQQRSAEWYRLRCPSVDFKIQSLDRLDCAQIAILSAISHFCEIRNINLGLQVSMRKDNIFQDLLVRTR